MTFKMWSFGHALFILSPFILTVILYYTCRNKTNKTKNLVGIALSIIAIILLLARNIEIYINSGYTFQPEIIPLQICHFANFVLLFAFLYNNKTLFALAFCLNLPAAIMSILFANGLENYTTLLTARGIAYILGHMLIVAITLYAWIFDFIKINIKIFLRTIGVVVTIYIISLFVNNFFNLWMPNYSSNYFYSILPEAGTPLEIFFNASKEYQWGFFVIRPLYLFLTSLLGAIVISVFYGFYIAKERILNKKIKHQ